VKRPDPKGSIKDLRSSTMMRWPSLSYAALPIIIIALTMVVALIGYSLMSVNLEGSRTKAATARMRENNLRISGVFDSYAYLLWGSTGRLQSAGMDEGEWQQFLSVYDLQKNFNGLEALGLTIGDSVNNQIISYVSPRTPQTEKSLNVSIGEIPLLAPTLEQAVRTGRVTVSDAVPDLFSTKEGVQDTKTGFLMFAPYYDRSLSTTTEQERKLAFRGFTVALFRGDIFFNNAYANTDLTHTRISIYLGEVSPKNLLHEKGTNTEKKTQTTTQEIDYYGKKFTFVFRFDSDYMLSWSLTYMPQVIFISALVIGMIFAGVAGYLLRSRYKRLTYEKERDVNFAKDELLSLASHQLRTPATGVKQYLGMVLQGFAGDVPDKQREYLERAYSSNNRQLHVINDILHLAKLETGRIVLTEREFDLAKMIRDVVDEQRDSAELGGVTITVKTPPRGLIVGDSHMLWMIVENLVSNAIKYTPAKGVVTVRLVRRGNRWVITVKDTGVGIAKKDFSKLFQQFSRIMNSRSDFVTGTGVGLYLAHHLTVLHGGSIGVNSTIGKGSTFTVRLPRKL